MFNISKEIILYIIVAVLTLVLIFSVFSNIKSAFRISSLLKQNKTMILDFNKNTENMNKQLLQLNKLIDLKIKDNQLYVKSLQSDIDLLYIKIGKIPVNDYETDELINSGLNYYSTQWKLIGEQ